MTRKKTLKIVCIAIFTFALVANLQYSILDYGLKTNSLNGNLFAQTDTGGGTTGGTTTGSTTTGGTTGDTNPFPSKRWRSCYPDPGKECVAGTPRECGPAESFCP